MSQPGDHPRLSLRTFWADLPAEARWLLAPTIVQTLGRGMTLPFTFIYLSEVRHVALDVSGVLMASVAVVGMLSALPSGTLTDRLGARPMLVMSALSAAVGNVVLAFSTTVPEFLLGFALIGASFGVAWPAFNAMIAAVTSGPVRQQLYGVNFALVNLGIGVGGVIGGLYVDVSRPATFVTIFLVDAAVMLAPLWVLMWPLRHVSGRAEHPTDGSDSRSTRYGSILRMPGVVWVLALTFASTFVGYGQIEAGLPGFARDVGEVSTRAIGFSLTANTATIVLLQFTVLGRIVGRRRTRALVLMSAIWAAGWLLVGSIGLVPATLLAAGVVILFGAVFALGETLLQPTIPALTNDLAPDHLRGRYNALGSLAFQLGAITAPAVAGVMLQHAWSSAYIAMLVAGCGVLAVLALRVERRITPEINGVAGEVVTTPV